MIELLCKADKEELEKKINELIPADGVAGYALMSDGEGGLYWGEASTEPITYYAVTLNLIDCVSSNTKAKIAEGKSYSTVLSVPGEDYTLGTPVITMGGIDITATVWNADTATITIESVTGDVIISCMATKTVDTSPVFAQEDVGYSSTGTINAYPGVGITKEYSIAYDIEEIKTKNWYDATNDYVTLTNALGQIAVYTPSLKMREAGYSTTSMTTKASKVVAIRDGVISVWWSNASLTASADPVMVTLQTQAKKTDMLYATGISFTVSLLDAEDSYAYWSGTTAAGNNDPFVLPVGIRSGDIIFAGKNTPYYGLANIDGTLVGETAVSELSLDDDLAQNYSVATTSILGEELATDTQSAYGLSSNFASVIDEVKTAWMIEYGGDYRKIPLVISTDQHGRTNSGIFTMLGETLSLHDVSKVCNLGDTCSVEWLDADTANPLLSCTQLENWNESIKKIPFSKRLDVFGNHDAWYGNYADEGNLIGTRYPSNLSHLDQYFRNVYARRNNNNGWFVIRDDYFNVKYVVISGFEFDGSSTTRISTAQMDYIITELSKDDGYDVVIVSHIPVYDCGETNIYPTGGEGSGSDILRFSSIDTDALFNARKDKGTGTIIDSEGVEHSYDFSACTSDILCCLNGHMHVDSYNYVNETGLLTAGFDWFDEDTFFMVLIDRVNERLNVWKISNPSDGPTYQNYQIPFTKVVT